ncbi:unnamed protein product, partial [Rotaria sordida]
MTMVRMVSQRLQMSEWSSTETSASHGQALLKSANANNIVSNDTYIDDVKQHHLNDQNSGRWKLLSKLSEYYALLSPFFHGLLLGIITAGLIFSVVITLWLTSSTNTLTTV